MLQSEDPILRAPAADPHARRGTRAGLLTTLLQLEQRVRESYLDRSSSPRLAGLDARLQHAYGLARRIGAAPLYLRQHLRVLHGPCGAADATVAAWGRAHDLRPAVRVLFDGPPAERGAGAHTLPALLARTPDTDLDLIVASTTPLLARAFRRRSFVVIPAAVQLAATVDTLRLVRSRPSKSLASDLLRVARTGYRLVLWPYSAERARLFQGRYLEPHARARFADDASLPTFERIDGAYRRGLGLALLAPGGEIPELLCVASERGSTLHLLRLGVCDGDHALLRRGAVAALYALVAEFAAARGLDTVHVGNSRPWLGEGVLGFKWKWGYRPVRNPAQTLEWAMRPVRPTSAAARRLLARRPIVRTSRGLAPLDAYDLAPGAGFDDVTTAPRA